MFELIAMTAFILGLVAFSKGRVRQQHVDRELAALKDEVQQLRVRLDAAGAPVETAADASTLAAPQPSLAETPAFEAPSPEEARDAIERAARGDPGTRPSKIATAAIDPVMARPAETLESRLGARWAVWVGGLALALGGVFMVKYSIDAGLVSPAVRLSLAAVLGLVLLCAGEAVRRRIVPALARQFDNAMIPGILTAAGAVTLFGVIFAAHDVYGFIGPGTAFALLAIVSLGTLGLSLLHGQGLAGLGLLASLATPAVVSTQTPNVAALFIFLSTAWLATLAAARLRRWSAVPALGNIGLGLWMLVYIAGDTAFQPLPVTLTALVMIAGLAFLWPADCVREPPVAAKPAPEEKPVIRRSLPFTAVTVTGSVAVMLTALTIISALFVPAGGSALAHAVILIAALAAYGAFRATAFVAGLAAAVAALAGVWGLMPYNESLAPADPAATLAPALSAGTVIATGMVLSSVFIVCAAGALYRHLAASPRASLVWSALAAVVPGALTVMTFFMLGDLTFDFTHGAFALAAGLVLLGFAEVISRRGYPDASIRLPQACLVAGAFGLFTIAAHAMTDGLATTLFVASLGALAVAATRIRPWPVLPWIMGGAAGVVLVRIGIDPTIVGPALLGKTPVFNALLAGYGIPTALLVLSAYELRRWPDLRVRNLLQALASLFALLTAAILVRHAMNGGVLDDAVPTLGEQSIYTLLVIGASAVLMTLDLRSPSPVFRYGSMGVGIVSMLSVLSAHLIGLNPYFTGEMLGPVPVFDLLLLGYLMPGLAYAGLALYARGKRPHAYVVALAVAACVLVFSFATLSVRRFWQGQNIADWKGFLPAETYTYSVVWLAIGVLLLVAGSRFNARSIRLASAVLVLVTVLKVFLVDMSNLEGFLRALSFIGLGAVLIGIGLFYQKILSRIPAPEPGIPDLDKATPAGVTDAKP